MKATPWANQPLYLDSRYAQAWLAASVAARSGSGPDDERETEPYEAASQDRALAQFVPAVVRDSGVAIVSITGPLVHRRRPSFFSSRGSSYLSLSALFEQLLREEGSVRAVLLDLDTPGGEVAGIYEMTAALESLDVPVWASVNDEALSAGYAIAAVAERIQASSSALLGSIGVLAAHVDESKFDEEMGFRWTLITGGGRKADLDSRRPLSDPARARLQSIVDHYYGLFVEHVAARRAGLTAEDVLATEARVYTAPEALELGLIDEIAGFNATLAALETQIGAPSATSAFTPLAAASSPRSIAMSGNNPPASQEAAGTTYTQEQLDAAVKTATEKAVADALASAKAEGHSDAVTAERERVAAIMGHESAEGRSDLAKHLALETPIAAEQAAAILAKSPKEAPAPAAATANKGDTAFEKAMGALGNADIGADSGNEGGEDDDAAEAARVVALYQGKKSA